MNYKKAGRIVQNNKVQRHPDERISVHAVLAFSLMFLVIVAQFLVPKIMGMYPDKEIIMYDLEVMVLMLMIWTWSHFHLSKCLGMNPAWGFLGVLFVVGTALLVWIKMTHTTRMLKRARRPKVGNQVAPTNIADPGAGPLA